MLNSNAILYKYYILVEYLCLYIINSRNLKVYDLNDYCNIHSLAINNIKCQKKLNL